MTDSDQGVLLNVCTCVYVRACVQTLPVDCRLSVESVPRASSLEKAAELALL